MGALQHSRGIRTVNASGQCLLTTYTILTTPCMRLLGDDDVDLENAKMNYGDIKTMEDRAEPATL